MIHIKFINNECGEYIKPIAITWEILKKACSDSTVFIELKVDIKNMVDAYFLKNIPAFPSKRSSLFKEVDILEHTDPPSYGFQFRFTVKVFKAFTDIPADTDPTSGY